MRISDWSSDVCSSDLSSVGVFLDGVFLAREGGATGELADIERVEILRGPQGTRFGANTAAGLVNIGTRRPWLSGVGGFVEGVAAEHDLWELRGSVSGPLFEDRVGLSVSAYHVRRGGLTHNATTGRSVDNIRRGGGRAKVYIAARVSTSSFRPITSGNAP